MPIYEYQTLNPKKACQKCRQVFEVLQGLNEPVLSHCPECGKPVRKVVSWCRAAVTETSDEQRKTMSDLKAYENAGMWSHAAELADIHSEKTKDRGLKTRALDNYKKAGYDTDMLSKHDKNSNS